MVKESFGQKIRLMRKQAGYSQESFALMLDMSRTYYSGVENGKHNISIENIARIAKGLNVSLSELMKGVSYE